MCENSAAQGIVELLADISWNVPPFGFPFCPERVPMVSDRFAEQCLLGPTPLPDDSTA